MNMRLRFFSLLTAALLGFHPAESVAKAKGARAKAKSHGSRSSKSSKKAKAKEPSVLPNAAYVRKQLEAEGFSKPFIKQVMKTYEVKGFEEVLRLNVILYLKKSDYHGIQVTEEATRAVRKFSEENKEALKKAEEAYHVPGEVIASLLFIESRFGKSIGNYHIPSVYLHMIQAPRVPVQKYLLSQTYRYTEKIFEEDEKEILARTKRKADWAMGELHALEKVYDWKWDIGKGFRGSFSGAFGMPQFLPSSYIKWARSMNPPAQPQLNAAEDAIQSVGHYLSDHGWKTDKSDSQVPALMKYNNSKDYAKAILALADKLDTRSTASEKAPTKE
jgi:membrane-bound lytic murein transglycosylase B